MTNNPTRADHAAADIPTVQIWDGLGSVAKFVVALIIAVVGAAVTALRTPATASTVLQAVVLGLGVIATFALPGSPAGIPDTFARWYQSAKTWAGVAVTVLSVLVPFVATYVDTGDWRTLTGAQWLNVMLAVLMAYGVWATPNREVVTVDADGNGLSPTAAKLDAIRARRAADGADSITTLD